MRLFILMNAASIIAAICIAIAASNHDPCQDAAEHVLNAIKDGDYESAGKYDLTICEEELSAIQNDRTSDRTNQMNTPEDDAECAGVVALGTASASAVAAMPALVYVGSDIDLGMLHLLRDSHVNRGTVAGETRAIYVDAMRPMNPQVFASYHQNRQSASRYSTKCNDFFVHDPTICGKFQTSFGKSFEEDTAAFRPWPGAATEGDAAKRARFAQLVARRLRDEGKSCVEIVDVGPDVVTFGFLQHRVPRRLDFVVADALDVARLWDAGNGGPDGGCDPDYCGTACIPFAYCTDPAKRDANCADLAADCGARCDGCLRVGPMGGHARQWMATETIAGVGVMCEMTSEAVRSFALASKRLRPGLREFRIVYGTFPGGKAGGIRPDAAHLPTGVQEALRHYAGETPADRRRRCSHQEVVWLAQFPAWRVAFARNISEYPIADTLAGFSTVVKEVVLRKK